jgi:hypothetical protein
MNQMLHLKKSGILSVQRMTGNCKNRNRRAGAGIGRIYTERNRGNATDPRILTLHRDRRSAGKYRT